MTAGRPPSKSLLKARADIDSLRRRVFEANEAATHWHKQWTIVRTQRDVITAMLMEHLNVQSRSASKQ